MRNVIKLRRNTFRVLLYTASALIINYILSVILLSVCISIIATEIEITSVEHLVASDLVSQII